MKLTTLLALAATLATSLYADFSYTTTTKVTGGSLAAMMGGNQDKTAHLYIKGRKVNFDSGDVALIFDYDAQTITTISKAKRTVSVQSMAEKIAATPKSDVHIELKETGQKKVVNGFNAAEIISNIDTTVEAGGRGPIKVQAEITMWIASDVPGVAEFRALSEKNGGINPFSAASGNPGLQSSVVEIQKKIGALQGIPVQQIIRLKSPAGITGTPQVSGEQSAKMQDSLSKARAQLEAMVKQGGPAAAIAQQQLARLPGAAPAAGAGSTGSLIEMTIDSSGFSTAAIPDSTFAIPADYQVIK